MITESPALRAREEQILAGYTDALAALLAEETGARARRPPPARRRRRDDRPPPLADRLLARAHPRRRHRPALTRDVRAQAQHAFELLEGGLGDYDAQVGGEVRRDAALDQRAREQIAVPAHPARRAARAASPAATRAPTPRSAPAGRPTSAPPATISVGARISAVLARSAPPAIVTSARTRASCDATSAAVRPPNEWPKTPEGAGAARRRRQVIEQEEHVLDPLRALQPPRRRHGPRGAERPRRSPGSRAERTAASTPPASRSARARRRSAGSGSRAGPGTRRPDRAAGARPAWRRRGRAASERGEPRTLAHAAVRRRRGVRCGTAPAAREQHQRARSKRRMTY